MKTAKSEFLTSLHKSLTDDINHISDDLLRAKWFFLASIAAIGTAYLKIYDIFTGGFRFWGLFLICLIGNIIFWFICEYILSHAFLFRFLQSRLAKIEKNFDVPFKVKDPTEIETFIRNNRITIDYIIPDQFVPIYWASTWLIIINSFASFFLQGPDDKIYSLDYYIAISFLFIGKLWTYYGYKLDKFIEENCSFKISSGKDDHYFQFPNLPSGIIFFSTIVIYLIITLLLKKFNFDLKWLLFWGLISYFWFVPIGMIIHFLRIFLRFDNILWKLFSPKTVKEENNYNVERPHCLKIFSVLYNII